MRHLPVSLRKLAIAGAAGTAIALTLVAPASATKKADAPVLSASKNTTCVAADKIEITWTVSITTPAHTGEGNIWSTVRSISTKLDGKAVEPKASTPIAQASEQSESFTVTLEMDKSQKTAQLDVIIQPSGSANVHNSKFDSNFRVSGTNFNWDTCKEAFPVTKTDGATTPAANGSAPKTDKPAALAVTGSNAAVAAAGAVALLGAGTAMFFVARRRRVRFTTPS